MESAVRSCFHPSARDSVCPSAWRDLGAWSHWRGTEWDVAGPERRDGRMEGKNGGEAQLAAASNWAEQVSMADQTHMQRGSKERVGHKQSSRAGEAAGAEEVGRRARGWSHSSSHSLFVTGGRERQLSPPYRNTHTPPCVVITLNSLNTQKITTKKSHL